MRLRFIPLLVLLLPLIEIAGFVIVGSEIGVLWTIALVIASSIAGSVLMRYQGLGVLRRAQAEMEAGRDPGRELANGAMILLAGLLLLIPGFVTDIFGILLFLPPVRGLAWRAMRRHVVVAGSGFAESRRGFRPERGPTIDLDAEDYTTGPRNPESPWNRLQDK